MDRQNEDVPRFMLVTGEDLSEQLVNLSQVNVIQKISTSHIRLVFNSNLAIEIEGETAKRILAYSMSRSILPDGTPTVEAWAKL
jgi:hypothetical protein